MPNYNKGKKMFRRYLCRKDWHHKAEGHMWSYYNKKSFRDYANKKVRLYKGSLSNGGFYKKVFDLEWAIW